MPAYQQPRLPSQLTYNDLNGEEALNAACDWFRQLLQSHPLFQRHLTLPMADIAVKVELGIDMYVGGTVPVESAPEHLDIGGKVVLQSRINAAPIPGGSPPDQIREQHGMPVPTPGYGSRETGSHLFLADVEVKTEPYKGPAYTGAPEPPDTTGGRHGVVAEGYVFSSEPGPVQASHQDIPLPNDGNIAVDLSGRGVDNDGLHLSPVIHKASVKTEGDQKGAKYGSVSGIMDAGPAGLGRTSEPKGLYGDGRQRISFGNSQRG
jgi:hypothetical protein